MSTAKGYKYRFFLINDGDRREVRPVGTQTVTYDRQDNTFFYQQNIGQLTFNDDHGDFQWIRDIEAAGDICKTLYIEVERKCPAAQFPQWELWARSEWTIQNTQINPGKCTARINPDPTGAGACLINRGGDSIDMFQAVDDTFAPGADGFAELDDALSGGTLDYNNGRMFFYNDVAYHTTLIRPEQDGSGNPTLPPTVEEMEAAAGIIFSEEERSTIRISRVARYQETVISPVYIIYVAWAYRRLENKIAGVCPETPKGYRLLDDTGPQCLYQKLPTEEDMSVFPITAAGTYDRCNNIGVVPAESSYIYNGALAGNPDYPEGFCVYLLHKDHLPYTYLTLSLERALEEFAGRCGVTEIVSDFYQINPENPSGTNYVTGDVTHTNDIRFVQKGNALFPLLQNARTGLMSWNDLTGVLEEAFQSYWTIDAQGRLRYEHVSFYENVVIGLDTTTGDKAEFTNQRTEYSYKKELLPYIERIADNGNHHNYDWDDREIKYIDPNGDKLGCVGTDTLERSLGVFQTDLDYMVEYPTDDPRDGWLMVACNTTSSNPFVIPFDGQLNGHMSIKNLVANYYNHNRSAEIGQINGVDTTFISTKKLKEQDGLIVPLCCDDDFEVSENVKTPVGIGRIVSSEHDLKTDKLTLKTEY